MSNSTTSPPLHPGEILKTEFMAPLELSQNRLAMDLHVPAHRIMEIVHGKRRISADTALRLAKYFRTTPEFWLKLQMDYDLALAREALSEELERQITTCAPPGRMCYES